MRIERSASGAQRELGGIRGNYGELGGIANRAQHFRKMPSHFGIVWLPIKSVDAQLAELTAQCRVVIRHAPFGHNADQLSVDKLLPLVLWFRSGLALIMFYNARHARLAYTSRPMSVDVATLQEKEALKVVEVI